MNSAPLVVVRNLVKHYRLPRERLFEAPGKVLALDDVSFEVRSGRNFGIVGESGSGKSFFALDMGVAILCLIQNQLTLNWILFFSFFHGHILSFFRLS